MANETTSSTISELYTEIVQEALFVAQEQSMKQQTLQIQQLIRQVSR
jgi:hypothetical protein